MSCAWNHGTSRNCCENSLPEGTVHEKEFPETSLLQSAVISEDQRMVENRAAALLNLLGHGAVALAQPAEVQRQQIRAQQ